MVHTESDSAAMSGERTCAGCRQKAPRDGLLRFVLRPGSAIEAPAPDNAGEVVPDIARKLPGRGVSVHPRRSCLDTAVRAGRITRTLRASVAVDAATLARLAAAQYRRRVDGLLLAARRSRALAIGETETGEAISRGTARAVVVAQDAAARRQRYLDAQGARGLCCLVFGTKSSLGQLFGREAVAVFAICEPRIAEEVSRAAARAADLEEGE